MSSCALKLCQITTSGVFVMIVFLRVLNILNVFSYSKSGITWSKQVLSCLPISNCEGGMPGVLFDSSVKSTKV